MATNFLEAYWIKPKMASNISDKQPINLFDFSNIKKPSEIMAQPSPTTSGVSNIPKTNQVRYNDIDLENAQKLKDLWVQQDKIIELVNRKKQEREWVQVQQQPINIPWLDIWVKASEWISEFWRWLKFDTTKKFTWFAPVDELVNALKFAWNIPWDTIQLVWELGKMVSNPVWTAKDIETLAWWILEWGINKVLWTDIYTSEEKKAVIWWIKQSLQDNFWTFEKAKETIYQNPTDTLLALQWWLNIAKKGITDPNKLAQIEKIEQAINPINILKTEVWAVKWAIKWTAQWVWELGTQVLGKTTWTSAETIKTAFKQWWTKEFQSALKWETTPQDILWWVKQGLEEIKMDKNKLYWEWAKILQANKNKLDIWDIQKDLIKTIETDYKVKILNDWKLDFSQSKITWNTSKANIQSMYDDLVAWQDKTPDWLDTLKQRIQDYFRWVEDSWNSDRLSTILSNKIKDKITWEVPEYKTMMKDYEKVTNDLRDITKTLSLGKNIQSQTAITKLNSILRDNFTARQDMVKLIEQYTGKNIQAQVAGASLNPALAKWLAWVITWWWIVFWQLANPAFWAWLWLASPRLIWEIAKTIWVTTNKLNDFITNVKKYGSNMNSSNVSNSLNNLEWSSKKLNSKLLQPKKLNNGTTNILNTSNTMSNNNISSVKPKLLKKTK